MAVPTNIRTLFAGNAVEWARIEFKETWDAEASLKTICAFANNIDNWGGGYLIIGVEEKNGRPIHPLKGVPADKVDGYLKDMLNKCKRIQPEYLHIVEVVDYQNKKFIVVWAPGGYLRPILHPNRWLEGRRNVFAISARCPARSYPPERRSGLSITLPTIFPLMTGSTTRRILLT